MLNCKKVDNCCVQKIRWMDNGIFKLVIVGNDTGFSGAVMNRYLEEFGHRPLYLTNY